MASIDDRWHRKARGPDGKYLFKDGKNVMEKDPDRYGKGKRWRVRYLDPDGEERSKSFTRKVDADSFKTEVEADVLRGTYIAPDAGKITFQSLAEEILEHRTLDPGTREGMKGRLRRHVYPVIGSKEIGVLSRRPSIIQQLVKRLSTTLAPTHIEVIMAHVGLVFTVAIDDELIAKNPLRSSTVVLPAIFKKKLVPWSVDQLFDVTDQLPGRYQAVPAVGGGLGLRRGEIFALSPDDIDWLRGVVAVRRQLKLLKGRAIFALPKGGKTREVPLPESVKLALAEHMSNPAPIAATLPWGDINGPATTVRLFFSNTLGLPVHPSTFHGIWHAAIEGAGIVPPIPEGVRSDPARREHGLHMLRHFFVSSLLAEGESVAAVSEWAGHHSAKFTLDVYGHLMPFSEQRMRKIIDATLRRPAERGHSEDHGPAVAQKGIR